MLMLTLSVSPRKWTGSESDLRSCTISCSATKQDVGFHDHVIYTLPPPTVADESGIYHPSGAAADLENDCSPDVRCLF